MGIRKFVPNLTEAVLYSMYMIAILVVSLFLFLNSNFVVFFKKRLDKSKVKYELILLALMCLGFQFIAIGYGVIYMLVANVIIDFPLSVLLSIERLLMLLVFIQRLTTSFETTKLAVAKSVKNWLYIGFVVLVFTAVLISYSNETNHVVDTIFISVFYFIIEISLSVSILVAFAKRLFILMKMCSNENADLEYKSTLYSSSGNVFDDNYRSDPASQQNNNNDTQENNAGDADNIIGNNVALPKKKTALNVDQMEYLHLIARLTLVNLIAIVSGQIEFWYAAIVYEKTDNLSTTFASICFFSLTDVLVDQICVYFAFSFNLKVYQKLCSYGHYWIYQCCLWCIDHDSCCCPKNTTNLHHVKSISLNKS